MRTGLGLMLAALLAGCGGEPPAPAPSTAAADATPENAPGISLTEARVQLPAVAGRPGAAYFTVSQASGAPRAIAAVHVAGAGRAEMHESRSKGGMSGMATVSRVPLGPGVSVRFAPGGLHAMLFDLAPTLRPSGTAELTVTLDNGDKATTQARVEAAGAMAEMEHMH